MTALVEWYSLIQVMVPVESGGMPWDHRDV